MRRALETMMRVPSRFRSRENVATQESKDREPADAYYYLFTGVTMAQHSAEPIERAAREEMKKQYGENVYAEAFPSIVPSVDPLMPGELFRANRFENMADKLEEAFDSGKDTTIVLYSMGAAEFNRAFLLMLERRERRRQQEKKPFEALNLEKVHIVLRSPAGLVADWGDRWRQFVNSLKLMGSASSGPYFGVDHLATFPPKDQDGKFVPERISQALAIAYPNVMFAQDFTAAERTNPLTTLAKRFGASEAQVQQGEVAISQPLLTDTRPDYLAGSEYAEIRTELQKIDNDLVAVSERMHDLSAKMLAAQENGNEMQVRFYQKAIEDEVPRFKDAFEKRTDFLVKTKLLKDLLANKGKKLTGPEWEEKPFEKSVFAFLKLFPTLRRAFASNNLEIYKFLQNRGASFELAVPWMDIFLKSSDVSKFIQLDPNQNRRFGPLTVDVMTGFETTTHSTYTTTGPEDAAARVRSREIARRARNLLLGKS